MDPKPNAVIKHQNASGCQSAMLLSNKSGRQQLVNVCPLRSDVPFVILSEDNSQDLDRGIQSQPVRSIPSLHARDSNGRLIRLLV